MAAFDLVAVSFQSWNWLGILRIVVAWSPCATAHWRYFFRHAHNTSHPLRNCGQKIEIFICPHPIIFQDAKSTTCRLCRHWFPCIHKLALLKSFCAVWKLSEHVARSYRLTGVHASNAEDHTALHCWRVFAQCGIANESSQNMLLDLIGSQVPILRMLKITLYLARWRLMNNFWANERKRNVSLLNEPVRGTNYFLVCSLGFRLLGPGGSGCFLFWFWGFLISWRPAGLGSWPTLWVLPWLLT